MSVTLFALVLACAPAADVGVFDWTLDLDGQLLGKSAVDAGKSENHLLLGVRGGMLTGLGGGVETGFDLALHIEPLPRTSGSGDLNSVAIEGSFTPRGVIGWRASWGPLAWFPYLYAGPFGGLRLGALTAFGEVKNTSNLTFGVRTGFGMRFKIGHATLGLELGGGWRERGPEVVGVLSSGFIL